MLKFILINGKAGSGKDTFAKFLNEYLFLLEKKPLIVHNASYVKAIAEKIFGWDKKKDNKGRKLLIDITNAGYNYDEYFWERKTEDFILKKLYNAGSINNVYVIIPDFRYKKTLDYFKSKYKVFTIKIERDFDNKLDDKLKNDISENLDIDFDLVVYNNGTLDELKEQAKIVCEYFRWW